MYCPSCDKSYGAVHSRCPECHSWLKVSAPANSRAKSAKAASGGGAGSVSTLDKPPAATPAPVAWSDPPSTEGPDWSAGAGDSWSDALPAPSRTTPSFSPDPAPVSDSAWGGGGAWGGASAADSWSSVDVPASKAPLATPSTPAAGSGAGWLGGSEDGWGGGLTSSESSPTAPSRSSGLGGGLAGDDWGGGLASSAPVPTARAMPGQGEDDGWGSSSASLAGGGSKMGSSSASSHGGWLDSGADEEESAGGWLGDSRTPTVGPSSKGDGWLGDDDAAAKAPSMTEMVDRAIGEEEADDFVDDSWVDEEVDNGEFDDLEVPETHIAPTPEVGSLFLKMLLVAVLVLLVGGGVMFLGQEQKTPEQLHAEEMAKELAFARSSVETGKNHLKEGKPLLALGPLKAAITSFKTAGGSEQEILGAKTELARALMKAQEYQEAYEHWAALAKGPEEFRKEARQQMAEVSKLLRSQANDNLTEAVEYAKNGEATSVISLGESALKIFNEHQGTATQKGKAWGIMGRGFMNGGEYGKAKDAFKKAMELNPGGNYQVFISQINAKTAPVNYYSGGGGYTEPASASRPARPVKVEASIGDGPSYVQASGSVRRTSPRRTSNNSSSGASAPPPASTAPARPQTRSIPAYQPRSNQGRSSGQRPGSKNVLPTY
jgi:hypothetical protein